MIGETWAETGEAPDWQRLYERREDFGRGTVPAGRLFLTAGADVQKDRIEVSVWAWGRSLESWLVDHVVVEGGPGEASTWAAELSALLGEPDGREQGGTMVERTVVAVPASTAVLQAEFLTSPAGGGWTMAEVDAATFGVKVA